MNTARSGCIRLCTVSVTHRSGPGVVPSPEDGAPGSVARAAARSNSSGARPRPAGLSLLLPPRVGLCHDRVEHPVVVRGQLFVVADEYPPPGAGGGNEELQLGHLAGLVDDEQVELLLLERPAVTEIV